MSINASPHFCSEITSQRTAYNLPLSLEIVTSRGSIRTPTNNISLNLEILLVLQGSLALNVLLH